MSHACQTPFSRFLQKNRDPFGLTLNPPSAPAHPRVSAGRFGAETARSMQWEACGAMRCPYCPEGAQQWASQCALVMEQADKDRRKETHETFITGEYTGFGTVSALTRAGPRGIVIVTQRYSLFRRWGSPPVTRSSETDTLGFSAKCRKRLIGIVPGAVNCTTRGPT